MTVQTEYVPVEYVGNNSTSTPYVITFPFSADADVFVKLKDANDIVTDLVNGIDFTVSGSNVTTTIAYDSTYRLVIGRITEVTQLTDYVENDSFPAASHEAALDKLTLIAQELTETFTRVPKLSPAQGTSGDITPATNDSFIYIDTSGNFVALTAAQVAALLSVAGGVGVNYTKVWADDTTRASTLPEFVGQVGIQLDQTGIKALYRSTGTSIGNWTRMIVSVLESVSTGILLGRHTAGSGDSEEIALGRGLSLSAGALVGGSLVKAPTLVTLTGAHNFDPLTRYALVELQGAGGGGGGFATVATTQAAAGQGGCAGGYVLVFVDVAALTSKVGNFVIGAAGVGVSGAAGTSGGNTTYSDDSPQSAQATGGTGGGILSPTATFISGSARGFTASSGGIYSLYAGTNKVAWACGTSDATTALAIGSSGEDSKFGIGGYYSYVRSSGTSNLTGANATGYGAGGAGAAGVNSLPAQTGGDGTPGCALIWEYK